MCAAGTGGPTKQKKKSEKEKTTKESQIKHNRSRLKKKMNDPDEKYNRNKHHPDGEIYSITRNIPRRHPHTRDIHSIPRHDIFPVTASPSRCLQHPQSRHQSPFLLRFLALCSSFCFDAADSARDHSHGCSATYQDQLSDDIRCMVLTRGAREMWPRSSWRTT